MPSKYVFPGGAVDAGDALVTLGPALHPTCAARLAAPGAPPASALAAAAIRELWEETGLALGCPGQAALPPGWAGFAAQGLVPDASALRFVFRAITPPGRSRRFDARFFLADAARKTRQDRADLAAKAARIDTATRQRFRQRADRLEALERTRASLGHAETLKRGFAIVRGDGAVVTTKARAEAVTLLEIEFQDGRLTVGGRPRKGGGKEPPGQGTLF
jgi:8-oxo-dGTP pyrophosphatase MutT (NUDIX family)